MAKITLLAGSYNRPPFGEGKGIYVLEYDTVSGETALQSVCEDSVNPSYLARVGDTVLAAQETLNQGGIAAYRLQNGALVRTGGADLPGGLMCHVEPWPGGGFVSAANYWTGSLVVCAVKEDTVGQPTTLLQYRGKGADPKRQEGPHTHSSRVDPSGKWLAVAELGIDRIMVYRLYPETGALTPGAAPFVSTPAGMGPRHFAFHPNGRTLYVSAELKSCILVYDFNSEDGSLALRQTLSALPDGFAGGNLTADIHCAVDGRLVYASNRGHDSIASFRVSEDGMLEAAGWFSCFGSGPRSFRLMEHSIMLIANQGSGNLVSCLLDGKGGCVKKLAETAIPSVVCTLPLDG